MITKKRLKMRCCVQVRCAITPPQLHGTSSKNLKSTRAVYIVNKLMSIKDPYNPIVLVRSKNNVRTIPISNIGNAHFKMGVSEFGKG